MILALSVQLGIWKGGGTEKARGHHAWDPLELDGHYLTKIIGLFHTLLALGWSTLDGDLATCTRYTDRSTPTGNSAPVRFDHDDEETPRAASGRFKEHHHMARYDSTT